MIHFRRFLLPLFALCLLCAMLPLSASAQSKPAYTRLSDEAVLKMGHPAFVSRYGKSSVGGDTDSLLFYFSECHARRNNRAARRVSPAAAKQIAALRKQLANWDAHKFSPADDYTGGELARNHHDASAAVEREEVLEQITAFLVQKPNKKPSDVRAARAAFARWLGEQQSEVKPLPEEWEDLSDEGRAAVRARYASWHKTLQTKARTIEGVAATLPAPAAEAFLLYACRR